MQALLVAFGSHGDVLPMIAIGAELRRRGHKVALASAEPFAEMTTRAGLAFEALATTEQFEKVASSAALWRPVSGIRTLLSAAAATIRPALEFVERRRRKGRTIVVGNSLAFGARMSREAFGVPMVTVHLSAALLQSRLDPPRFAHLPRLDWLPAEIGWRVQMGADEHFVDPVVTPRLNAVRAERGLPPVRRLRYWWNAPFRTLLMCPDWFVSPQPEWPPQLRQCGFPAADRYGGASAGLDPEIEAFLGRDGPVAVLSYGSAMPGAASLYRAAVAACAREGLRALVLTSTRIDLPTSLAGIAHVAPFAPLSEIAGRCAVAMHHGGVGTLGRCFAAGVPQLVTPFGFDQFDNAERASRLGCVSVLRRWRFTVRAAAAKLAALRGSPEVAEAARRVADLARVDGTTEACDLIEAEFAAAEAARAAGGVRPQEQRGARPTG